MSMPAELPELATELRAARDRRGMSQAQAAAEIGTTQQTLGRWEKGDRPQARWHQRIESFIRPPATVSPLRSLPTSDPGEPELSEQQLKTLEAVRTRISAGASLSAGEVTTMRAMFRAVGLAWDEG